jgi:hypothetical protein
METGINSLKAWFDKPLARERRRAERWASPELAVYYWTGATPREHPVGDISSSGVYVVTEERWSPGAMVLLTLQRGDLSQTDPDRWIAVQSKVTRWGSDGVGLTFVLPGTRNHRGWASDMENATDRKKLDKFLSKLYQHDKAQLLAKD